MKLFAESALLPDGWRRDVLFEIGPEGDLAAVTAEARPEGAERLAGPVLPDTLNGGVVGAAAPISQLWVAVPFDGTVNSVDPNDGSVGTVVAAGTLNTPEAIAVATAVTLTPPISSVSSHP